MINKDGGDTAIMMGDIELVGGPTQSPPLGKTLQKNDQVLRIE